MMNVFSKFKVALLGTILSFGLIASVGIKGVTEAFATGETEPTTVTDVITADKLPATSNRYVSFTKLGLNADSKARFSGLTNKKAKDSPYFQLNSTSTSYGIVSSVSGGILKSITVNYPINARTLNIYASSATYSSTEDLYAKDTTPFAQVDLSDKSTPTLETDIYTKTITFSDGTLQYIGFRSAANVLQLSSISITWQPVSFGTLDSIYVTNEGTTRYVVGEKYSKEGIAVTKRDTQGTETSVDSADFTTELDNKTFAESDIPLVTNTAEYGGKKSAPFNIEVYAKSSFEKVTTAKEDWTGTYIIVAKKDSNYFAFDSSLGELDVSNNNKNVVDTNGVIADAIYLSVKIEKYLTGYSIQSYNGNYIGTTTASNGINSQTTKLLNTISFDGTDGATIVCDVKGSPMTMRFNSDAGQERFRYYKKSSTGTIAGTSVALYEYKATESTPLTNWANQINNALSCDNGATPPDVDAWNNIKTTYFDNVIKAMDLETIRNEVANPNGTNLQKALAKYDYIISKYGDTQYQNYLERNIFVGKANVFGIASNSNLPLISILSLIGIGSILGVTFLLKKKKENK